VISFTPLPLYTRRNSPLYQLVRRLGGPQSWSGLCGEEINGNQWKNIDIEVDGRIVLKQMCNEIGCESLPCLSSSG
jgi:hypothetical protein